MAHSRPHMDALSYTFGLYCAHFMSLNKRRKIKIKEKKKNQFSSNVAKDTVPLDFIEKIKKESTVI